MERVSASMDEIMKRMKKALDGTGFCEADFRKRTPEEKAQQDADMLNAEIGHENDVDGYECDICRNKGYIYYAKGMYTHRRECECANARLSIRRMQRSGLGDVIHKYTFAKYKAETEWQQTIKEKAQQFLKDEDARWFFIGGASGAGKSHICTAICRNLLKNHAVHYMKWETERNELKACKMDADVYQPRMNRLKNIDVLYIDDFFSRRKEDGPESAKVQPTGPDIDLARELLDYRYSTGKITIISSEWYSMEIFDLDNALGGRIIERGGKYCINVGRGKDKNYRLKMAGELL